MSVYEQLLKEVSKQRCPTCCGTGQCDDSDFGDIFFKTWKCTDCNGTGMKNESKS